MNGGFFMAYILDIAVILIFVLAIFIGYRRGFVKSIIRLVGCLLALVIAGTLSGQQDLHC